MKHFMKLTGLMMSALLCLFTSCSSDDEKDDPVSGPSTVKVTVLMNADALQWVEGTFDIQILPSGRKEKINVNDITFAFNADAVADKSYLSNFTIKDIKKATLTTVCDGSEQKVILTPNLKVKSGAQLSADVKVNLELNGIISKELSLGSAKATSNSSWSRGIPGDKAEFTLNTLVNNELVTYNLK